MDDSPYQQRQSPPLQKKQVPGLKRGLTNLNKFNYTATKKNLNSPSIFSKSAEQPRGQSDNASRNDRGHHPVDSHKSREKNEAVHYVNDFSSGFSSSRSSKIRDRPARRSLETSQDGDTTKKDACYLQNLKMINQENAMKEFNQDRFRIDGYESMDSPLYATQKSRNLKRPPVDYSLLFKEQYLLEQLSQMSKTSQIKFLFENLVDLREQTQQLEEQKDRNLRIVEKFESDLHIANNDRVNLQNQVKDREQTIRRLES